MTTRKFLFLLALTLTIGGGAALAQSSRIDALRRQIESAEAEVKRYNSLLTANEKSQKANDRNLSLVQGRIYSRQKMVEAMQEEIDILNGDLKQNQSSVNTLSKEQQQLKDEYAVMIRESYRNYLQNNYLAFLFAARDFNDVTRRIDYMRRYNNLRESKSAQIDSLSGVLQEKIVELDTKLAEVAKAKAAMEAEMTNLGKDEKQYETLKATLKANETKYTKERTAKELLAAKARKEIDKIIAEESKKQSKQNQTLTAEQRREVTALTGRFDQNRGKMPYPVRGGVIISRYGLHQHPTNPRLTEDNKGVNIAAAKGAAVRSVFDGTVTRVVLIPGMKHSVVIISHGEYLTAYSNLAAVTVKPGDKVAMNQNIGALSSSDDSDEHYLHFEVWKGTVSTNPEWWLIR